jgi:polyribonucleotide nucleotidyltransferase
VSTFKTIHQRFISTNASQIAPQSIASSSEESKEEIDAKFTSQQFTTLVSGPPIQFGIGKIANLTESSIIGSSGQTVALVTVAAASLEDNPTKPDHSVLGYLRRRCKESSSFVPLTVDYRQRHHAVGKIPTTADRSDNRRPTNAETLASRAIDRALRPLMKRSNESVHLTCSIQACPVEEGTGGYPVSLALNSASVTLKDRLKERVACVVLCLLKDGTVLVDPSIPPREDSIGELLFAGTRDKVVMMEFSGILAESQLVDLIALAHGCIQPLLDTQEETAKLGQKQRGDDVDDATLRASLGLQNDTDKTTDMDTPDHLENEKKAEQIFDQAMELCKDRLGEASLRLFGVKNAAANADVSLETLRPKMHSEAEGSLLSKSLRGRREQMLRKETKRLLLTFEPDSTLAAILQEDGGILADLVDSIHSEILRAAMREAAIRYKCRADGRGAAEDNGCSSIRPLSMEAPALPDVVHGSSLFTRGETQVLCTATLGPPKDGILLNDPYKLPAKSISDEEEENKPYQDLPVGSLRYLRNQEHLESDLNSRKIRADREQTGDSGILKERRRAFLQYDFPAYSKGEVQVGPSGGGNRREIGHGALAEKAILPVLPPANDFPYAIRMTSEVTSSNGSSSMASVCGATLALLDAGVPVTAPVAGVSVGLAKDEVNSNSYQLLLDITGTEDYYGSMDFKIAGTDSQVTAFQLDVKKPLSLSIVSEALDLAKDARVLILQEMESQSRISSSGVISELLPRSELKASAPRVEVVRFDPMRKKDLLGPGGAVIRQMEDRFNVSLDLTQEGQCLLFGDDQEMVKKAKVAVMDLVADVEVGGVYEGTVIELRDFGAIIELLRNKEGLCHVSELAGRDEIRGHPQGTIGLIHSILRVGQKIEVTCTAVDPVQGTIRLRPANKKAPN